jgi:hypothetical protein
LKNVHENLNNYIINQFKVIKRIWKKMKKKN